MALPRRPPRLHPILLAYRVAMDAFYRFNADDGWAIASHIALSFLVVLGPLMFRTALAYMPWLAEVESHFNIGRFVVATVLLVTSLLILHMWLPAGRRQFAEVWPGIVATLVMWMTCGFVFGRYLSSFYYTYVTYYAGLASAMMALVFLYFIALIFIYGGELNAAIARVRERAE